MNLEDTLIDLLARVGAQNGAAVFVGDDELSQWPPRAVEAMKSQRLLTKARPATSAICPGCEHACVMPVHTFPRASGTVSSFIVCDKRSDINRVPVSKERLNQWRCDAGAICGFIAASLGLRRTDRRPVGAGLLNIGIALGGKHSQMLCLKIDSTLTLVAGTGAVPLAELVGFHDGKYLIEAAIVRELVGSAASADHRYTPNDARRAARKLDTQAMYKRWQEAYRRLRRQHPNMSGVWYSQQIAKQQIAVGRDAETIRKYMKR